MNKDHPMYPYKDLTEQEISNLSEEEFRELYLKLRMPEGYHPKRHAKIILFMEAMFRDGFNLALTWKANQLKDINVPQSTDVMSLEQIFDNKSDCYADAECNHLPIAAMTKEVFVKSAELYDSQFKQRAKQLEKQKNYWHNEFMMLNRNYDSDKKHYAVIEKSNEQYVEIINKHIESGDNVNWKQRSEKAEQQVKELTKMIGHFIEWQDLGNSVVPYSSLVIQAKQALESAKQ